MGPSLVPVHRLLILTLFFVAACGPAVSDDASGQEIYEISCARCHGDDLGGTRLAPGVGAGSALVDKDDAYAIATVTRGRGNMPSFENPLTAEQIESVMAYVRSRQ